MTEKNFAESTAEVLERVERESGRPVELYADPGLQTYASVKMARGPAHAHVLTYNPSKPGFDYHVAYQCGFVLRLYENAPGERYEFGGTEAGRSAVRELVTGKGGVAKKLRLPKAAAEQVTDQFFDGIMTQLRSYPIGMRIDQWIGESYPDLRDGQRASVEKQLQENAQALGPRVRQMAPDRIFSGNASMNAAYALFCDRLLSMPRYVVPYRSVGFEQRGRALLDLWDGIPPNASHDRQLVDAWAEDLGVSDWYRWVPVGEGR